MQQIITRFAEVAHNDIEGSINALSIRTVLVASLLLVSLLAVSSLVVKRKKLHRLKTPLFVAISATILLPTLLLMGSTIYINTISDSGGPVHWHADIEFWVCGQEIELRNPTGALSNKIGTATYHEHDDKRIHLEGVVVEKEYDASLKKFMDVTYGNISNESLVLATEDSIFEDDTDGDIPSGYPEVVREFLQRDDQGKATINVQNGQSCGDDQPAELQVFKLSFNKENNTYTQEKLANPGSYTLRDESTVPPGDCVIVEFDTYKSRTERLCQQYGIRDSKRCVQFGVSEFNPELCNISEDVSGSASNELDDEIIDEPTPTSTSVACSELTEESSDFDKKICSIETGTEQTTGGTE